MFCVLSLKAISTTVFKSKIGGLPSTFLALRWLEMQKVYFFCQRKYALEIVKECGLLGAKSTKFPMEINHKLSLTIGTFLLDPTQYRRLIGQLIYLTLTRSELSIQCTYYLSLCNHLGLSIWKLPNVYYAISKVILAKGLF